MLTYRIAAGRFSEADTLTTLLDTFMTGSVVEK
jgi:hypothetical protein